jgi:hypothetical protein
MRIEMSEWAAGRLYEETKHHAYLVAKAIADRHAGYIEGESHHDINATNLNEDLEHLQADQATMAAIEAAMEAEKKAAREEKK